VFQDNILPTFGIRDLQDYISIQFNWYVAKIMNLKYCILCKKRQPFTVMLFLD